MRTKAIITGAIAVLTAASLTLNAGSATHRTVHGSAVGLAAATTSIARPDGEALSVGSRSIDAAKSTTEPAEKSTVEKPAAPPKPEIPRPATISATCQQAINNLKVLFTADLVEDAAERASQQPPSVSAIAADQAEDVAEAFRWRSALMAARTACLPPSNPVCLAAIVGLQAQLEATRTEELSEWLAMTSQLDWVTDWTGLRSAFASVASACADQG